MGPPREHVSQSICGGMRAHLARSPCHPTPSRYLCPGNPSPGHTRRTICIFLRRRRSLSFGDWGARGETTCNSIPQNFGCGAHSFKKCIEYNWFHYHTSLGFSTFVVDAIRVQTTNCPPTSKQSNHTMSVHMFIKFLKHVATWRERGKQ